MKITIKLFLTFLAVSAFIILTSLFLARWSFHQGLLDFVSGIEQQRLDRLARILATEFRMAGNSWAWLDGQDFQQILEDNAPPQRGSGRAAPPFRHPHEQSGPFPGPRPDHRPPRPHGPKNTGTSKDTGPMTALLTLDDRLIFGVIPPTPSRAGMSVPVELNGKQIAILKSWPNINNTTPLASQFSRQQLFTSLIIAALCLAVAGAISWLSARRLLKPVKKVLNDINNLSSGTYTVEYSDTRRDELGQLMQNVQALSLTLAKNRSAKQRLFADISHELRTPLTVLAGEIEVMKAGLRPFDMVQLSSLEQEIKRLSLLVDDLYQLSLSDIGGLRYHFEAQELNEFVAFIVAETQHRATEKGLALHFQDTHPVWVNIDKQRFEQLLINLLNNSLAYTDSGGQIRVTLTTENDAVTLRLDDSLPGVSDEECQQLFEPLFRKDSARTRRESGAGLGMTISKNIVEAHGGHIEASPSPLGGLSVTVTLNCNGANAL